MLKPNRTVKIVDGRLAVSWAGYTYMAPQDSAYTAGEEVTVRAAGRGDTRAVDIIDYTGRETWRRASQPTRFSESEGWDDGRQVAEEREMEEARKREPRENPTSTGTIVGGLVALGAVLGVALLAGSAEAATPVVTPPKDVPPPAEPPPDDEIIIVGPGGEGDICLNGRVKILPDGTCPVGFLLGESLVAMKPGDCGCVPIVIPPSTSNAIIKTGERVLFVVDANVGGRAELVAQLKALATSTGNPSSDLPMAATNGVDRQTFANNAIAQGMLNAIDTVVTLIPNPVATDWIKKTVEILEPDYIDPGYAELRATGSPIYGIRFPTLDDKQFNVVLANLWAQLTNPNGTTQTL